MSQALRDIEWAVKTQTTSNIKMNVVTATATYRLATAVILSAMLISGSILFSTWLLVGAWMTPIDASDKDAVKYEKYLRTTFGKTGPYL